MNSGKSHLLRKQFNRYFAIMNHRNAKFGRKYWWKDDKDQLCVWFWVNESQSGVFSLCFCRKSFSLSRSHCPLLNMNGNKNCLLMRSGQADFGCEVNILQRVKYLYTLVKWALESPSAQDKAHAAGPFIDDCTFYRFCQVWISLWFSSWVYQAGSSHITVYYLVPAHIDRMVWSQFRIHSRIALWEVYGCESAMFSGIFCLIISAWIVTPIWFAWPVISAETS